MNKQEKGRAGENAALASLIKKGYVLLWRNYRAARCEIDLVMEDEETLVFLEVKARYGEAYGHGREAVTPAKQRNIIKAAQHFALSHAMTQRFMRFDVVEVDLLNKTVCHIKDAFRC